MWSLFPTQLVEQQVATMELVTQLLNVPLWEELLLEHVLLPLVSAVSSVSPVAVAAALTTPTPSSLLTLPAQIQILAPINSAKQTLMFAN
jgi:hypothetical protein